jgi:hypothetical protein
VTAQAGQAPGVVKIRLSGAAGDVEVLADVLSSSPAAEVIDRSAPTRTAATRASACT